MNSRDIFIGLGNPRQESATRFIRQCICYAGGQPPVLVSTLNPKSKVMKKSITSDWKRLLPALYVSLLVIAVLWMMPRNARAQLYVGNATGFGGGGVSKYSAKTGHVINANFITGLSNPPLALAVDDNTLFVSDHDSIGKYDATTGAVIKKDFFTGLRIIIGLVLILPGKNTGYSLAQNGVVWTFDATTGAVIDANFITGLGEVGGLAVFGSEEKAVLFVTDRSEEGGGTVGEYDANTGFTINRHFITGLSRPTGLAVTGNTLFVANTSSGTVG